MASLARTVCPSANTHVEQPLALPRTMTARQEAPSLAESPVFPQIHRLRRLGPGCYTFTILRQQVAEEWRGCFYTTMEPDPNSVSDSYDPTREFFNIIDGAVATTDNTEDDGNVATTAAAPAARADLRTPRSKEYPDPPPPQDDKAAQLVQLRELKTKLDEDRERVDQLELALKQDQTRPHGGGA